MKEKTKHIPKRKFFLIGTALFSICAVLFYIFYCTKSVFWSDMAYWLLMADEQIRTHQFFPNGFYYTTGVPIISPELIVLILRFFCQNWLLCRELAVLFITLALFLFIYLFYKKTLSGSSQLVAALTTTILICLPMEHYMETFFSAAYEWQLLWNLILMLALNKLLADSSEQVSGKKSSAYIIWFVLVFLCSMRSIKSLFIFTIPLILAFLIFAFIESGFRFEMIFKNKKRNFLFILTVAGTLLGTAAYILIAKTVSLDSTTGYIEFAGYEHIGENINAILVSILHFYGAIGSGSLVSVGGVTSCINFVILVICTIVAPIWMLLRYKKSDSSFWKFYTIYAFLSNFIILYTMVFTVATNERYYESIFWHNIIFTTILFTDIIKKKDKYYELVLYIAITGVVLCGHLNYAVGTVLPIHREYSAEKENGTLIDFLKENNLTYGFASFWHAYKYMALSDGEIMLISSYFEPLSPMKWMSSESYFDTKQHPGRCFILVASDETLPEKYYSVASETKEYQDYKILIFDKNIFLYDELK